MKHALIAVPPLVLFLAVVAVGERWTRDPPALLSAPSPAPALGEAFSPPTTGASQAGAQPAPPPSLVPPTPRDPRVPAHLEAPLRAVVVDLSLCVSRWLLLYRGPVDIDVVFTPEPAGAFARGTRVFSSWHDAEVEACVAEVFDEATFFPTGKERPERAEFVFRFPDDAQRGLLGLTYSRFR